MRTEEWVHVRSLGVPGKVIERANLWGTESYRVWVPSTNAVVRVPLSDIDTQSSVLSPQHLSLSPQHLSYVTAAARVSDALTQDILLAPIEASVIPLPHQIRALSRAVSADRVRYLLADEVGLGKTIEAGLIMRELKLRGLVRRTLVVAPKGLVTQWVSEMRLHLGERFHPIAPDDIMTLRRISEGVRAEDSGLSRTSGFGSPDPLSSTLRPQPSNVWKMFNQVVCPMDLVKPLDGRRGWSRDRVAKYNRDRFEDLTAAGWDLIIVDEAHRLGGSTEQVARYKLGRGLAEAAPYLLLLSATPHQGKSDAFYRVVSLLDEQAFPDIGSIAKERVHPYVIRTEKRRAIDADGRPLFKPRTTTLVPIAWQEPHRQQQALYQAVTEYVREGYNQAIREKKSYIGFLMILMQRLVTSSTRAIGTTLARRLEVLGAEGSGSRQAQLFGEEILAQFPDLSPDDYYDLDGQEQMETLLTFRLKAIKNERAEVKLLLEAARRTEESGPDAKAEALLDWIYRLQQEAGDPDLKVLIFTEFVPTQEMLREFLTERGFSVVCLNGSMGMDERAKVQESFAGEARILVSTDAGGEGLNLQFCHVVVNYDTPWNPMRLEQRIGRVDRIGQDHPVRAVNFVIQGTVEHRVREVLEEKLAVILEEFGVDKTGDILDSAQGGRMFDDLYAEVILRPEELQARVESVVQRVRQQGQAVRDSSSVLGSVEDIDPGDAQRLLAHPLPYWVERMTVGYLQAHGGRAVRNARAWDIMWPGEEKASRVVFSLKDAERIPAARHLTLEDQRVRGLATRIPPFAPGQPIPCVTLNSVPAEVRGLWSLWRITLHTPEWNRHRVMPLFLHEDGRTLAPTARFIWDQMLTEHPPVPEHLEGDAGGEAFERVESAALEQGRQIYDELAQSHRVRLAQEREKGAFAFAARRRAVQRIGLPAVREHRLRQLAAEEAAWRSGLEQKSRVSPELLPLIIIRVESSECGVRSAKVEKF